MQGLDRDRVWGYFMIHSNNWNKSPNVLAGIFGEFKKEGGRRKRHSNRLEWVKTKNRIALSTFYQVALLKHRLGEMWGMSARS